MKLIAKLYTILALFVILVGCFSCEQEKIDPVGTVAAGGGTVNYYSAYTLDSVVGEGNVYGRVVFWKDNAARTLIQVALYNTLEGLTYSSMVLTGAKGNEGTELASLGEINGGTGELESSKFYVVADKEYFSSVASLDAHINIYSPDGTTVVAVGDIGNNATPVEANLPNQ